MTQREGKQQYLDLRRKLSDLNYTESFGVEACDLISHLLSDLISTTNSYKIVQEKEARIASDLSLSQAQLFPLRKENARLARENHDLHNDTIRLNDEIRNATEDHSRELQRAQEQLQDSRFLNESFQEQLRQKAETIDKLRHAYDTITDPSLKAAGGSGTANANRAIKMTNKLNAKTATAEMEALKQAIGSGSHSGPSALVAEKENIIKTLRAQLDAANKAFATKEEECRRLNSAVAAREQEIARSSKLITGGAAGAGTGTRTGSDSKSGGGGGFVPGAMLAGNMADQYVAADIANKRIIDQLNSQVDFLNNELAKREAQLVEVNDKLLQYDSVKVELAHRNQLLDQARKDSSQSNARIRALEQKVIEYQNVQAEYAAAMELSGSQLASPSTESKQEQGREAELKVVLGKVSSERDELREEVARLRRITSTLSVSIPPVPAASSSASAAGASHSNRSTANARASTATAIPGRRATATAGRGAGSVPSTGTAGARVAGEKERQQAATNVLVIELNAEIEGLQQKVHVLTRSVTQKEEAARAIAGERDSWRKRAEAAEDRKDKSELQKLHMDLQDQYSHSQLHLSDANRKVQELQTLYDAARDELSAARNSLHDALLVKEETEVRLSIVSRELALCRQASERHSDDLAHASTETARLRMDCEDLKEALVREKQRGESAQRVAAEAQALLDSRSVELAQTTHELAVHRMSAGGAGLGDSVEEQMREDRKKMQARVQDLEKDQLSWQRERRALQRIAQSLGVQVLQEKAAKDQIEEQEVVRLLDAVSTKDRELSQALSDLHDSRAQSERLTTEVEYFTTTIHTLEQEVSRLHDEFRDAAMTNAQLKADLELSSRRFAELRSQQEEALQQQLDSQSMGATTAHQLSSVRRELQAQVEAGMRSQQAIASLEEERDFLRRQVEDLNRAGKTLRGDLQRAIAERQEALGKGEELKALVNNLESNLRVHSQRQNRLAAEVEKGGEEQQLWESERARLLAVVEDRDRRVKDQQEALQSLDRERDRLQEQLDVLEGQAEEQDQVRKQQDHQASSIRQLLEQSERKLQTLSSELTVAQRHAQAADARLNAAQLEINELKRRVSQKSIEVGGAAEDLMLMTRENQALTSELVEACADRDRLQQRLQQVLHASASTEHARRSVEVERCDLLNTYRAVLQEKRKLEEDLNSLSSMKQRDGTVVHQLQEKVADLQGVVAAQGAAETRWRGERAALLSQLDTLNDQLVRSQHKIEAIEAENRKMAQDTSGLKQNNVMLNERINMIIKRAGAATEANKLLTGRLGSVERERDAVRALVGIERQRASEMSHIAESARVDAATKELYIQRLRAVTSTTTTTTASAVHHRAGASSSMQYAPPQGSGSPPDANNDRYDAGSDAEVDEGFLTDNK